jgi:hypothetical protein
VGKAIAVVIEKVTCNAICEGTCPGISKATCAAIGAG